MLSTILRAFTRRRTALLSVVPLLLLGCEFVGSSELERPAPVEPKRYNVVPLPRVVVEREGSLDIGVDATISTAGSDPDLDRVASSFAERLRSVTGFAVPVVGTDATSTPSVVELVVDPSMADDEGYVLDATTTRVRISAKSARGIFYGIATLRQLLPSEVDRSGPSDAVAWKLPAVRIEDAPRFSYRGMHLDVSRHFFSVDFVKRYIDLMALYKLNTFHWHLTDDQGWRIDIQKYPRLVEVGAVRKETVVGRPGPDARYDGQPYGGFYTQEQIRDVVAYAAERFVTIVPEIEMPGHSLAALASYPDLACTPGPFETATTWGVFDDVLCPSEGTFTFLTDVLTEVIDLFPGPYVHVGGDEVPAQRWEESAVAQEVILREGLSSAADLGPYFVRRVGAFLESRGRKVMGWDEIAERGDIPGATVMSWRGVDKGVDAVRRGHPVVMTPIEYCYFDHPQGDNEAEPMGAGAPLTIDQVYRFDPAPSSLTAPQAALVMGGQANLWTEYIATQPFADYMVFPRMLALAEVVWSPQAARSYPDFLARLTGNAKHLDALSVNYAHQFQAP